MSVIIEDEMGWGVSFTSHNPEQKDFIQCASYEDAERLHNHLSAANQKILELEMIKLPVYFTRGRQL
jgi:hypothetical protein